MTEQKTSDRVVVFSDIHFGVSKDPTEDEWTNTDDLPSLLKLIEREIIPKKVILLGDVFDLWRVKFNEAWNNASGIQFFERLRDYSKNHDAEIIYVIGNHDHFLKEISYADETLTRYKDLISSGTSSEIKVKLNVQLDLDLLKDYNVKLYYPHYNLNVHGLGVIYFDHGHFNVKEERLMKWILYNIYKYGAKYFSASRIFKKELVPHEPQEIYNDLEANFSAVFSLLYHSKTDNMVRGGRDFIWRLKKRTWVLFSGIISAIIVGMSSIGTSILPNLQQADISSVLQSMVSKANLIPLGLLTVLISLFPRLSGILSSRIVSNTISGERGTPVDKVLPNITKKDISIERKNYPYIKLMEDLGNDQKDIDYYIFGHTHMAGWKKDPNSNLTVYNCGSWVKDPSKKTCINSFIVIDPNENETDRIKIYRIEKEGKVPCEFDKNGRCNMSCGK